MIWCQKIHEKQRLNVKEYWCAIWSRKEKIQIIGSDEPTLNDILGKFWFEVRTTKGEKYTVASLKHLRYVLNRSLKRKGHEYNIIRSDSFIKRQQMLDDACRKLKKDGKGFVKHYKEI